MYQAADDRYDGAAFRRCGDSGLLLPPIALGLWQNFGADRPAELQQAILRHAFDAGITHFDLANNYGPDAGAAESGFGRVLAGDFAPYRDEIIVSTKAGWPMWPGPYGDGGSRKYLLASLDASLRRLGVDYVDIFYHHRFDPETPLEETAQALDSVVRSGRALYVGISSYSPERTARMADLLVELGTPLLVHQPSYSMLNRWIEHGLLDVLGERGIGCVAFSPLAQGLLTSRYLDGIPDGSRAKEAGTTLGTDMLGDANLRRVRGLHAIARERGQSLAQMSLSWALRDRRVTSVLVGASSVQQLAENLAALDGPTFGDDELKAIDEHAQEGGVDLWREAATA